MLGCNNSSVSVVKIKNLNLQAQIILNSITTPTMILDDEGKIVACNSLYTDLIEIEYNDIKLVLIYFTGSSGSKHCS